MVYWMGFEWPRESSPVIELGYDVEVDMEDALESIWAVILENVKFIGSACFEYGT